MGVSLQRMESLALRELSLILRKDAKNNYLSNITASIELAFSNISVLL